MPDARLGPRVVEKFGKSAACGGVSVPAASNCLWTPDSLRALTKDRRQYSMPQPRRRQHGPHPKRRRALELLASSRNGATEAILVSPVEQMVEVVRARLAARLQVGGG